MFPTVKRVPKIKSNRRWINISDYTNILITTNILPKIIARLIANGTMQFGAPQSPSQSLLVLPDAGVYGATKAM